MDYEKLKALIELVGNSRIAELELDDGETKVRITRSVPDRPAADPRGDVAAAAADRPEAVPAPGPPPSGPVADRGFPVTSPMTGVFYRRPSPTDDPFVEVGSRVAEGETLALVEAMKTLNKVVAERAGTVRRILAEDGAAVEDDQPLFLLD